MGLLQANPADAKNTRLIGALDSTKRCQMKRDQLTKLSTDIIGYLDSHPEAADSIEGIAKWWLPRDSQASKETIACAIKHLVDEGVLEEIEQKNSVIIYKRRSAV